MQNTVSGADLIAAGYSPGRWFKEALAQINASPSPNDVIATVCARLAPPEPLPLNRDAKPFHVHIDDQTDAEREQRSALVASFSELMRTPTIREGALMPDACEAGPVGTIPVGGVVVTERAIHPGMHSSDICCSMFVSVAEGVAPEDLLNSVHAVTHFGPGGRSDGMFQCPDDLLERLASNRFLNTVSCMRAAQAHFGTAGDGNHFQSVGVIGERVVLTSHHGSRGLGALLYKTGMACAARFRSQLSPETLPINAWIPSETTEGEDYWQALQLVREWTKFNHQAIHDAAIDRLRGKVVDRFWNEHNFVFRKDDLFYHAKGATPVERSFLPDSDGRMIIPFNATEPIVIVEGEMTPSNLGFAPHGAGRYVSRTKHRRQRLEGGMTEATILAEETDGIDIRFFSGRIDITELPSAYKPATTILNAMEKFQLARVREKIEPFGCIMAGDWEQDAPWRKGKKPTKGETHGRDS